MVALFPWIIAVGVSTASAVVKDTVTVLPILAYVVSALLDAIDIGFELFNTCFTSRVSCKRFRQHRPISAASQAYSMHIPT